MFLSLIVCTCGRPSALTQLLESLNRQLRPPNEIIVVDASADDRTETIVDWFRSPSLRYFHVEPQHRGLTRQRNYGLDRAQGEIIAFLDDDTTPDASYLREIVECFQRNPDAGGVGGYIVGVSWTRIDPESKTSLRRFRIGDWECPEDPRWRLRRVLGLAPKLPPGWMPEYGHPRSIRCLPPDGADYLVESLIGCSMAFRQAAVRQERFDLYFEGYSLFEDFEFSTRISKGAPLLLCTQARLIHHENPNGRPSRFSYGKMFIRNGWYVWRRRWPRPSLSDTVRWWAISSILTLCRLVDLGAPHRFQGPQEGLGRLVGLLSVLFNAPPVPEDATGATVSGRSA